MALLPFETLVRLIVTKQDSLNILVLIVYTFFQSSACIMYVYKISTLRTATLMETRKGAYLPCCLVRPLINKKNSQNEKEQHPVSVCCCFGYQWAEMRTLSLENREIKIWVTERSASHFWGWATAEIKMLLSSCRSKHIYICAKIMCWLT
jgi:hypothetical protein